MFDSRLVGRARHDMVALFQRRIRDVWERDGFRMRNPEDVISLLGLFLTAEGPSSPNGARLLEMSGGRREWNRVFATDRPKALAHWAGPYLMPPVLDVLGGEFTVLKALASDSQPAGAFIGCERPSAYDTNWSGLPFPVYPVPDPVALPRVQYRTAFVSTVLHHEPDPERLLAALAAGPAERWVVIENAVDTENSEDFHLFVDVFFNSCLNKFDVPCVAQHRSVAEWQELLGKYGRVTLAKVMRQVPGMPFPYQMFVVDRGGRGEVATEAAAP